VIPVLGRLAFHTIFYRRQVILAACSEDD